MLFTEMLMALGELFQGSFQSLVLKTEQIILAEALRARTILQITVIYPKTSKFKFNLSKFWDRLLCWHTVTVRSGRISIRIPLCGESLSDLWSVV